VVGQVIQGGFFHREGELLGIDMAVFPFAAGNGNGSWPVLITLVALPQPTIAGIPNSRAMMAAWQVRPPWSVTMAAACFMIGSQSGSVLAGHQHLPG
jgi:hypothetical protein